MKAAVLVAPRRIEVQERPLPQPGPGEVRVRLAAVGICGSDVHYYVHGRIGSAVVRYPTLLGHEPSGVVDAVGEGVAIAPGTRVAIDPAVSCLECEACRSGRPNICPNVRFLGTPPYDGILAEAAVLPAGCCIPVPDDVSLVEAALLEPLAIGIHAVRIARFRLGETCAIFGGGPIGLVTLLAVRAAGATKVFVTDLVPERVAFAQRLGADAAMNAADGDVVAWVRGLTGGRGEDVAFEAAGEQATLTHACEAARIGGRVGLIGIPATDTLALPMHTCRRHELELLNVRRSNGEALEGLALVAQKRIALRPLATHFFPLERTADAIELVHAYRDGVIRAIVTPSPDLLEGEV